MTGYRLATSNDMMADVLRYGHQAGPDTWIMPDNDMQPITAAVSVRMQCGHINTLDTQTDYEADTDNGQTYWDYVARYLTAPQCWSCGNIEEHRQQFPGGCCAPGYHTCATCYPEEFPVSG